MVTPRAFLVDLDDTLLDYSGGADRCWEAAGACAPAALDRAMVVAALAEARRWFWSDPARHRRERVDMLGAWTKIAAVALARCGAEDPESAAAIAREYARRRRERWRLFPDARPWLEHARRRGVPLALVTNGDARQQRDKIERHDLVRYFETIVIEGELGAGKPDEIVYQKALVVLGTAPEETAMVGDHLEFDVAGPQRLGMTGIWLDREGAGLPANSTARPHRIIRTLTELGPA